MRKKPVSTLSETVLDQSVALVGNSSRILRDKPGPIVDRHDVVIRINRGLPSVCNPSAIGYRCDVWATAKYWPDLSVPADCSLVLWMKLTPMGKKQLAKWQEHPPSAPLFVWTQELEDECKEFVGADPGTGIRLLWWLRTHGKPRSVSCYGMDCWEEPTHWSGRKNTPNHSPELERIAMLKLL